MHELVGLHFAAWHVQITKDRCTLLECWMCQHMRCYDFCCSEPRSVSTEKPKAKVTDGHCCTTSVGGIALSFAVITFLSEDLAVCATLFAICRKLLVLAGFKSTNQSCSRPLPSP